MCIQSKGAVGRLYRKDTAAQNGLFAAGTHNKRWLINRNLLTGRNRKDAAGAFELYTWLVEETVSNGSGVNTFDGQFGALYD